MAKAKPAPAPAPPSAPPETKQIPYPRTWGSMDQAARKAWMKQHRPDRPESVAVAPVTAPASAPPQPGTNSSTGTLRVHLAGAHLVKIDVVRYAVRVGTRTPVECGPEELLFTTDAELDAWEKECQEEDEGNGDNGE